MTEIVNSVVSTVAPSYAPISFSGSLRIFSTTNKCLVIQSNDQVNGKPVQQGGCADSGGQTFTFYALPSNDGFYNITSTANFCLNVISSGTSNATLVDIETCNNGLNQKWLIGELGNNLFHLKPAHAPTMCLDNQYGSTDEFQIEIYSCDSNPASQSFSIAMPGVSGKVNYVCNSCN